MPAVGNPSKHGARSGDDRSAVLERGVRAPEVGEKEDGMNDKWTKQDTDDLKWIALALLTAMAILELVW
jgi:hypothetical protein